MIRIADKSAEILIYFPKLGNKDNFNLILKNGIGEVYDMGNIKNTRNHPNFLQAKLNFTDIPDGEYTYYLDETDCGLILIGNIQPDVIEVADKKEIKLKQYE